MQTIISTFQPQLLSSKSLKTTKAKKKSDPVSGGREGFSAPSMLTSSFWSQMLLKNHQALDSTDQLNKQTSGRSE